MWGQIGDLCIARGASQARKGYSDDFLRAARNFTFEPSCSGDVRRQNNRELPGDLANQEEIMKLATSRK